MHWITAQWGWDMSLEIVLEMEVLGDVRGKCLDTIPEWRKRNLVTLVSTNVLQQFAPSSKHRENRAGFGY